MCCEGSVAIVRGREMQPCLREEIAKLGLARMCQISSTEFCNETFRPQVSIALEHLHTIVAGYARYFKRMKSFFEKTRRSFVSEDIPS